MPSLKYETIVEQRFTLPTSDNNAHAHLLFFEILYSFEWL